MIPIHHLDINQPDFIADPYSQLEDLRDRLPVFHDEVWDKVFFTRYADIAAFLKDLPICFAKKPGAGWMHQTP